MLMKRVFVPVLVILLVCASMNSQPETYTVIVYGLSQPDGRKPYRENIPLVGNRYVTGSGAPVLMEFGVVGFDCPNQDMSFLISYVYRRVRPTNFLEDPSLYVMEGFKTTTTVTSESCLATWETPTMRDGIHTIGILAFDGAGAQSSWLYITIVKNNERDTISYFPGGDLYSQEESEEPPISREPVVIIDTPDHAFRIGSDPVQYITIYFHTNYPLPVEYFYVEWTFTSGSDCNYSSYAVVYPTGVNEGFYRLDMSSVFAEDWDEPSNSDGACAFGPGVFVVSISCKTANGLGDPSDVIITIS